MVGLEGFQRDSVVAEKFIAHLVEIILADPYRQLLAPIILYSLQHDRSAGDKFLDTVGPGPYGRLQLGRRDVALAAPACGCCPQFPEQIPEFADDCGEVAMSR